VYCAVDVGPYRINVASIESTEYNGVIKKANVVYSNEWSTKMSQIEIYSVSVYENR